MPWTSQQIESFPRLELQRLGSVIDQIPPSFNRFRLCQQAILGWRKYVAPHTPPESDLASHTFPPDNIFNAVAHLLSQTAKATADPGYDRGIVPHIRQLMSIWPTVWIWIRLVLASVNHLPKGTRSEAKLEQERNRHNAAIHALTFFLGSRLEQNTVFNELTTLVKETDGVLQMMATSWIQEARDQHAALGFPSSGIHQIHNPETISEFEQLVLAGCGGSEDEMASLAFHRIAHSLHLSRPNNPHVYEHLADDMLYIQNAILEPSATMFAAFTTRSGWVTFFVDVMFCLLSPRHLLHMPLHFALFSSAMELISLRIDEFQSYPEVRELLDCTPFLDVIARGSLAIRSAYDEMALDLFNWHCDHVIQFIYQFAMNRPILSRIARDLAGISAFLKRKATPTAISLSDMRSKIIPFVEIYKTFTTSSPPIFCCGNRECDSNDKEETLYRCSRCKLVLYCSNGCQKRDWRSHHKDSCYGMSRRVLQALFPMSSPDLRWLAHLITHDFLRIPLPYKARIGFYSINYALPQVERHFIDIMDTGPYRDKLWHDLLTSRKSGHGDLHPTRTVGVQVLFPLGRGDHAGVTALLTHPMIRAVQAGDVHVTWILYQ